MTDVVIAYAAGLLTGGLVSGYAAGRLVQHRVEQVFSRFLREVSEEAQAAEDTLRHQ